MPLFEITSPIAPAQPRVPDSRWKIGKGKWFPSTIDFKATADRSGALLGQPATFDALLDLIGKRPKNSMRELGLIGHANSETFSLAGEFKPGVNDLVFHEAGMIHPDAIKKNFKKIMSLRDRFERGWGNWGSDRLDSSWPAIILYSCDAGTGKTLLHEICEAFHCIVLGFKNEIFWCFRPSGKKALRGGTFYDSGGAGLHPDCSKFSPDIRVWRPDSIADTIEMDDG